MRLQVRAGLRQAWRRPGRLQIGLDPERGVVLDGLNGDDEVLLAALTAGTSVPELLRLAQGAGVPELRVRELLAELRAAAVLTSPSTVRTRLARLPDPLRARLAADAAVLAIAHRDGDGWDVLADRRSRAVVVAGAGRTGLALAMGLAAAGVGAVHVQDAAPVHPWDVQPGGYRSGDVGRPRGAVAGELLATAFPEVTAHGRSAAGADLVVLVGTAPVDPAAAAGLLRDDVPHLLLTWGERDAAVGPLVLPGTSSCLRCQHLHRCDRDPEWPQVVAQLGSAPGAARCAEEGPTVALVAALAGGQVLAHLDGQRPAVVGAAIETTLPERAVAVRTWPPHPQCGCIRLPGVAVGGADGTMAS